MTITSRINPKVIAAASLSSKKKRDETGLFLIEGRKLFLEAVKRGADIQTVFVTEKMEYELADILDRLNCEKYTVSDGVYEKLSLDKSPDGVICTAKKPQEYARGGNRPFIICDMQDAGNLGTCIRTALALGISPLILAGDCADVYNPKTVRASMGAVFSQNIMHFADHESAIAYCRKNGFPVYAAALRENAKPISEVSKYQVVFAVGNEGHGLPEKTIDACNGAVIIPMEGDSESLNASAAAAILMWETRKI